MTPRIVRSSLAVVLLAAVTLSASAQEPQRCNSSAQECEQEIRRMLSGRRYFGAVITDATDGHPGVLIKAVLPDGPAIRQLKEGDRIMAVNGHALATGRAREFKQFLAEVKDTGTLFMIVQRRGASAYQKVEFKLEPYPKAQIDKIIAAHLAQSHAGIAAAQP